MPETPETHKRITKIQKDIAELKQDREDTWHLDRHKFEELVNRTLSGDNVAIALYLEIDGERSIMEIVTALEEQEKSSARMTLWHKEQKLIKNGLIRKIGNKGKSPIYQKKRWAEALNIDDYAKSLTKE